MGFAFFWTAGLFPRFLSLFFWQEHAKSTKQSGGKAPQSKKKAKPVECVRERMNTQKRKQEENLGLAAIGSAGGWEVAIDETTSGVEKWFAQIEGPSIYLYFAIPSPHVVGKMLDFLTTHPSEDAILPGPAKNGQLMIGKSKEEPVNLMRDDEFSDRFFLIAETKGGFVARVTIAGADLRSFVAALRQAKEDLDEAVN
jgi:hypothetical protein